MMFFEEFLIGFGAAAIFIVLILYIF